MSQRLPIAVLISGGGRTLQNFIELISAGRLDVEIKLVIASKATAGGLGKARAAQLATLVETDSAVIFAACDAAGVKLICLAGWLRLLDVPARWQGRVMNIHPALLPGFGGVGMYGLHAHAAVLAQGCKVSGCTVHFVDNTYDTGPIILQRVCPVLENDTPESLAHRVFEQELLAYPQAISLFAQRRLKVQGDRVTIDGP